MFLQDYINRLQELQDENEGDIVVVKASDNYELGRADVASSDFVKFQVSAKDNT